jgi:hypothetical protein
MKRLLYEAPVDDFLSPEAKEKILGAQNRKYQKAKEEAGGTNLAELISYLPNLEYQHRGKLLNLAKALFFSRFPKIKERIDNGTVSLNVNFSSGVSPRTTKQTISPQYIEKAKEVDPLFDERVKARNFINATTQGSAWAEGFNLYKDVESQLNQLDPQLVDKYKKFETAATVFYNDNLDMLEQMAQRASGRVAYTDIVPDQTNPGSWIINVEAPNFPLVMHELYKAGRYFNSLLYLPKDKDVNNTLTKVTDIHKHEIRNMITGREISSKLRFLWSELIDDYETWMDSAIQTQFNKLANDNPKLFNEIMYDGVLSGKSVAMDKFEKFSQMIVNTIKKNPPKMEKVDYNKLIQSEKEPQSYEEEDEEEDDLSWLDDDMDDFNVDDEEED